MDFVGSFPGAMWRFMPQHGSLLEKTTLKVSYVSAGVATRNMCLLGMIISLNDLLSLVGNSDGATVPNKDICRG